MTPILSALLCLGQLWKRGQGAGGKGRLTLGGSWGTLGSGSSSGPDCDGKGFSSDVRVQISHMVSLSGLRLGWMTHVKAGESSPGSVSILFLHPWG